MLYALIGMSLLFASDVVARLIFWRATCSEKMPISSVRHFFPSPSRSRNLSLIQNPQKADVLFYPQMYTQPNLSRHVFEDRSVLRLEHESTPVSRLRGRSSYPIPRLGSREEYRNVFTSRERTAPSLIPPSTQHHHTFTGGRCDVLCGMPSCIVRNKIIVIVSPHRTKDLDSRTGGPMSEHG
jgi:hypothetical protein